MDAENTHQVFDWLWSSGQLSERDIVRLPTLGIEVVVNLALPTSSNALPGEAELITKQGLAYIQIPVGWERPEPEQFVQFIGVLNAFAKRKIWIHCAKNMRVSAFIYLYRKHVLGESEEQASFPMREVWSPNETWQEFINCVAALHSNHALNRDWLTASPLAPR
ncbi:protein tyrosine phosphatase family protein [Methylobacter luteus]|uniref:protein tyrosine phosphatase family protein n=1 Tax=Methylobacter luteus TaxID=415 RepID=UPI00068872A8|nr:protein tyrosine phosphatase family protein [Methylobacter luteus]